jgi:signal transduction histidine kinase
MIALFLVSAIFAILCYRYDPKSPSLRWVVFLLICSSLAGLSRAIIESFIPALNKNDMNFDLLNTFLYGLRIFTGFVSIYFCPYGILMHAVVYSGRFTSKVIRTLKYILLIPIPFMVDTTVYVPDIVPDFDSMLYWAVPYICIACIIHIYAYMTEKDEKKKKSRFITLSLMFPVILTALILNYIVRAFNSSNQIWRYVVFFLIISFFIFIWKALGSGSLNGIKLRYEREAREKTSKAVTSGTSLLNHSIKNQIYKINSSLQIIQPHSHNLDASCQKAVEIINKSSNHLIEMVDRMQSQTQEIQVKKSNCDLSELIDETLNYVQKEIEAKGITVEKVYEPNIYAYCDSTHTKEVFLNIIKNSIESMDRSGNIRVVITKGTGNQITVSFTDDGSGISEENLRHVTEPFFTTKGRRGTNFGLGLHYCYDVMLKSNGNLHIESELNKGTTVTLTFPLKG